MWQAVVISNTACSICWDGINVLYQKDSGSAEDEPGHDNQLQTRKCEFDFFIHTDAKVVDGNNGNRNGGDMIDCAGSKPVRFIFLKAKLRNQSRCDWTVQSCDDVVRCRKLIVI